MLWPEQAKPLVQQWQQQRNAAALPTEQLNGWHQGMATLEKLGHRLNGLDEQKGKYMTVSELKSVVFPLCSHLINRYRLKNSSDDCRSILLEMYFLKGRRLNLSCI